jgi:hypothetical protein
MKSLRFVLAAAALTLALTAPAYAQTQATGTLGTLTASPFESNAQNLLTGPYQAEQELPTRVAYTNNTVTPQDSLCFTAQVLGNGYAQGLEGFFGRPTALAPGAQASYPLGDITLPGPGSYLVQVSAFIYDRPTQKWSSGPTKIYWLFPLKANPLPVGLVSFTAGAAVDSVTLSWETATETNCKGFEVQRSINGTSWSVRGFVAGHGTTLATQRYRYTEGQLPLRTYYRLRQVDLDGQEHFSPVVALSPTPVAATVAQVYPNPAAGQAQLSAGFAGAPVRFYDEAGRQRRQQTLDATNTLDLHGLPGGTYYLMIGEGPRATRTRLVVIQ